MAKPGPVRINKQIESSEPADQPGQPEPVAQAGDPARQAIESALRKSQPEVAMREQTPEERAAAFKTQVQDRLRGATGKDGAPSPRRQATVGRLQLATSAFRVWDYITEFGTTFEDLLAPAYWTHIASRLRPWDQLMVRAEEGTFYAELIVTEVGQLFASVVPKPGYPFRLQVAEPGVDASVPQGYSVKWMGEHKKWGALRGEVCIKDGFTSQSTAVIWLQNVARARA